MSKIPMIILSLDGVGSRDLEYLMQFETFSKIFRQSAVCKEVCSVYPSLTYPAHTSIVTGRYPCNHGVVNNFRIQPSRKKPDWFWSRRLVKGKVFYEEVRKQGYKTAALLWPVTGRGKITYHMPEVWPNRFWQNQVLVSLFYGSPKYQWELNKLFGKIRKGTSQPALDDFIQESMLYTLERYHPDLMLVHFTDVDTNRHLYGVHSREASDALMRHEKRLKQVVDYLEKLSYYKEVNLIILGDHYQKDVQSILYPNYWFLEQGYLQMRKGKVKAWNVLARECDGACYVYVKNEAKVHEVGQLLRSIQEKEASGIKRVIPKEEAISLGADPMCSFMLEAQDGYLFQNECLKEQELVKGRGFMQMATHGYLPDEDGYRTFFMACGPSFMPGAEVEKMSLVDIGATLSHVLGVELFEIDGKILHKFLK